MMDVSVAMANSSGFEGPVYISSSLTGICEEIHEAYKQNVTVPQGFQRVIMERRFGEYMQQKNSIPYFSGKS